MFQGPAGDTCLRLRTVAKAAGAHWILAICMWNMQVLHTTMLLLTKRKDVV